MKLFFANPKSQASAEPSVIYAPGDYFFVRRFDLPAGMTAGEIAGYVQLQLEELSPFTLEQLYHGYAVAANGTAVLVYAAYRRRFEAGHAERWASALFVMPDFAPALRLECDRPSIVLLRSEAAMTALRFDGVHELPERVVSRPLRIDGSDDEARPVRERLLAAIDASDRPVREMRVTSAPEQRAQGTTFVLGVNGEEGGSLEVVIPASECWGMDVRDASFVAQQRRRLGFDLILWRVVQGAAAAVALLLLGELLMFGGRGYAGWLAQKIEKQAPVVASLEDRHTVANRLADFGRSGLSPFSMLRTVWGPKPESVYFTRTTAEGRNNLTIDATTRDVADANAFEAALKGLPEVETVELRNMRPREDETTFSVVVKFKEGSFGRVPTSTASLAISGGGS